jgi:hypothetical protein
VSRYKKKFLVYVARYNKKEGEFFLFGWLYIKIRKYKGNTREEKYRKGKIQVYFLILVTLYNLKILLL